MNVKRVTAPPAGLEPAYPVLETDVQPLNHEGKYFVSFVTFFVAEGGFEPPRPYGTRL